MKHNFLLIFAGSIIGSIFSKNINSEWPVDDSKPFPYPTPDPINIISSLAEYITTPTPLVLTENENLLADVTNTGSSLIAVPHESSQPTTAHGGVLYNETYILFQKQFFWDLSLLRAAGATIDGSGAPIQVVSSFYNKKYDSLKNAVSKRDGIFQAVVFIYVGPTANPKFYPAQRKLPRVREAGTTITIPITPDLDFFLSKSRRQDYYAYPGVFYYRQSFRFYYSSTVTIWLRSPAPSISYEQFNATFASFRSRFGKPYSSIARRFPRGPRPIRHVLGGIKLKSRN